MKTSAPPAVQNASPRVQVLHLSIKTGVRCVGHDSSTFGGRIFLRDDPLEGDRFECSRRCSFHELIPLDRYRPLATKTSLFKSVQNANHLSTVAKTSLTNEPNSLFCISYFAVVAVVIMVLLRYLFATLLCNSFLQPLFAIPFFSSSLQLLFPTPFPNFFLQLLFATPFCTSCLQLLFAALVCDSLEEIQFAVPF